MLIIETKYKTFFSFYFLCIMYFSACRICTLVLMFLRKLLETISSLNNDC